MSSSRPESQSAQPEHEPLDTPPAGRDAKGRFTKSNPGGPGNPFARQVAKLRSALVNTVTEEDMQGIAKELTLQARRGNLAAIKLLFLYVLGKPAQTVNPDTLDLEEWQQIVEPIPQIMKKLPEALLSLPVETADELVGTSQQAVGDTLALPQQAFEKVIDTIVKDDPEGQESAEDERREASPEEGTPSTNGQRKPAETAAGPSTNGQRKPAETVVSPSTNGVCKPAETLTSPLTNGDFGRARSLSSWLAKIAAAAQLASERTGSGQRLGA